MAEKKRNKGIAKAKKERKQKEAIERKEAYDKLTVQQKLDRLDAKFGTGKGAARERARLEKQLNR